MKYPECETCVNRKYDPFLCKVCDNGDKYENDDECDYITVAELDEMIGE